MKRIRTALSHVSVLVLMLTAESAVHAQSGPPIFFHGGPVVSAPKIFVLFWGAFTTSERNNVTAYIQGFAQFLGNGASGNGMEPTLRQYGIWGARYLGSARDSSMPVGNSALDTMFVAEIAKMQNSADPNNRVPPYDPTLLVLVAFKGTGTCGAHHSFAGTDQFFAAVPFEACFGVTPQQTIETLGTHEISEMATDPYPFQSVGGWYFFDQDGILREVNDSYSGAPVVCGQNDTVTFPNGVTGLVPHVTDNIGGGCRSFTTLEHAGISAVTWKAGISVFVRGTDNALKVLNSSNGTTWTTAQNVANGGATWDAPAAIATSTTQDVFVRGGDSQIYQFHRTSTTNWTGPAAISSGIVFGPPAAANHNGHKQVFANGYDGHPYVFDDGGTGGWTFAALPIPNGTVQAMSPPRVFHQAGVDTINISFTGNDGHVYRAVWGTQPSCPPFVDLGATFVGVPWESSRPSDTTRADVFMAGPAGFAYQNIITAGTPSGFIFQSGTFVGGLASADWGASNINLFGRGSGASGGILYVSTASNGVAFNGFSAVSPSITVTSTPFVLGPTSGNVSRIFVRRQSDGHLIHQSFNGSTPGTQQDLGVVVH